MPNWVKNEVIIRGTKNARQKFIDAVAGDGCFDFNKIVPMPKSLDIDCGSMEGLAIYATLRYDLQDPVLAADKFRELGMSGDTTRLEQAYIELEQQDENSVVHANPFAPKCFISFDDTLKGHILAGRSYIYNKMLYGCTGWYDWANAQWGTKWNACDAELQRAQDEDTISFETAWCTPDGIIKALPAFIQKLNVQSFEIEWNWAEEQGYFGGTYHIAPSGFSEAYYESDDRAYELCESLLGYSERTYEDDEEEYVEQDVVSCGKLSENEQNIANAMASFIDENLPNPDSGISV